LVANIVIVWGATPLGYKKIYKELIECKTAYDTETITLSITRERDK